MTSYVGQADITVLQGASFALPMQYADDTGTPVNLAGYTAKMQVRPAKASPTVLVELSTANGKLVITDAAAGKLRAALTATETAALSPNPKGVYDVLLTRPDGVVIRLLEGALIVDGGVTRNG